MDFHFINTTADTHKPSLDAESQGGAGAPLPSPQEAAVATAGSGRRASSLLSAQTVTTTTVTTTTVTTFPPLRIPQTQRKRALAPDRYPLADVPVPPALEHFAMDLNGQRMYFSQRDMDSGLSGPDILASISSNTIRSPEPLVPEPNRHAHTSHILGHAAGGAEAGIQRAMTPLYTQDDAQAVRRSAASASASASASIPPPLVLRSMGREGDRSNSRSRRSSSPHSPDTFRHFHRAAYSPPLPSQRALRLGGDSPEPSSPAIASATEAEAAVSSLATIGGDGDELVASPGAVLPLPSPLLSPRARPESMDTDDAGDIDISAGGSARRQLRFNEATGYASADDATECATPSSARRIDARQRVPREMAAMYDMPAIMATYDNLPPSMQTYLLHQLLRRTPRPALQFAAQTLLPVLHRDFIGELPSEAAHHVMRFMGVRELCRAACVSRRWRDAVNGDRAVWRARLVDARYAEPAPRIHPLCHTYFGLAPCEPPRAVAAPRPTRAELDLALLARRSALPAAALAASAAALLDAPGAGDCVRAESNGFKDAYARCYRLNRNWQTGACRRFNFVCDSGSVVTCIQLTHKYIVAGFDTKTIHVFDIATGAPVRRLVGHDGGVWALAVVGSTVVSGSTDRTVRVWDLETGRCSHVFAGHASTVRCLQILLPTDVRTPAERARGAPARYEPREPLIVTGSRDATLRVWRLPSPTRDAPHHPQASDAASSSSSNNSSAAAAAAAAAANPYFARTLEGHSDSVRAVAAFGSLVVSGSYDCSVRVWDASTGVCLHRLEGHTAKVYTIVLDPDMHLIMSGSMDGTIRVWDWDTGLCLRICRGHLTLVGLLSLKHDTLVSGGADTTLRIWDHPIKAAQRSAAPAVAQRPFSSIAGDSVSVRRSALAPAPGSNLFAAQATMTAQQAGNIQQAHLMQQLQVQQRANDQIHHQQLLILQQQHQQLQNQNQSHAQTRSQDLSLAASSPSATTGGGGSRPVELADLVHTERHVMQQHTNAITCFQNDGIKMVSGADSTLKLWDARTGQFVRNLLSNLTSVWQVRFDNRRCVAAVNRNDVTYFEVMDFGV